MNRGARSVLTTAALAAALTTGAATGAATPASAHTELERSDPLPGARLSRPPAAAVLTFSGDVRAGGVRTRVVDPRGDTTPTARVDGSAVVVPVRDAGPGAYGIEYRVVSGDGHAISGTLRFEVYVPRLVSPTATPAATPTATASTAPSAPAGTASPVLTHVALTGSGGEGDGGPPAWLVAGLAVVGLAGASGAAVLATRRGGRP